MVPFKEQGLLPKDPEIKLGFLTFHYLYLIEIGIKFVKS